MLTSMRDSGSNLTRGAHQVVGARVLEVTIGLGPLTFCPRGSCRPRCFGSFGSPLPISNLLLRPRTRRSDLRGAASRSFDPFLCRPYVSAYDDLFDRLGRQFSWTAATPSP